jgi:hemoglobin
MGRREVPSMRTLFERVGGFAFLSKVVLDFYDRVLDDDLLAPYFSDVDMRRLIDHQTKFVAYLMDGPASYTDEHLRQIHARLGIDAPSFERMVVVLRSTLEDYEMADRDVDLVMGRIRARQGIIVAPQAA